MEKTQLLIEKLKADVESEIPEEEILQSFLPFFGKDAEADEKMAEALAGYPHPMSARLLLRMSDVCQHKRVQKTIKRSLYRLRNKGIAVESDSSAEAKSILRPPQPEPPEGFGSGIDFVGQRLLLLAIPQAGRGLIVVRGIVSDTEGIVDFSGEEMPKKGFRDFFKRIKERSPFPIVEMAPSYVGLLFSKAYALTLDKGKKIPQDYPRVKNEIERIKKEHERPLIYSFLSIDMNEDRDSILSKAGELLKADLFLSWGLEEDRIRPYADAVLEAEESKIVLNSNQKEGRIQEVYQKALSELFDENARRLYKRRLEEMAYVLFKLGRQEEAKTSLLTALDIEKPLNPIQPNPFLFQLVARSILALLAEVYEKKKGEPSFIVKP